MKQRRTLFPMLMIASLIGVVLRLWGIRATLDPSGLPANNHISTYLVAVFSLLMVLVFFLTARSCPGRSGRKEVLTYPVRGFSISLFAAILIVAGAAVEFVEGLFSGPSASLPLMCLCGFLSGICLMLVAYTRRTGAHRFPGAHLLPIVYLVIKLILNFKDWSTDPIILDYCFVLFALIFSLLAFYHSTGFLFDKGNPRKTLFYCLCAVFFSAMAAAEGIGSHSPSTCITYLGFLCWCCPVISQVMVPSEPDPEPEKPTK